jgi:hypothetical protein
MDHVMLGVMREQVNETLRVGADVEGLLLINLVGVEKVTELVLARAITARL